jgi:hypothetical protein
MSMQSTLFNQFTLPIEPRLLGFWGKSMNEFRLVLNPYSDLKQVGIDGMGDEYKSWSFQVMIMHEESNESWVNHYI